MVLEVQINIRLRKNMKTQEELNELKQEFETLTNKLKELTDEELNEVAGGSWVEKEEFKESGATIVHRKCF